MMKTTRFTVALSALLAAAALLAPGCASTPSAGPGEPRARLFTGMGPHGRAVSASPRAQQFFDQGLTWAYAFNHDEAIRSFTEAARLDPSCAMAWWGVALCHGPHINNPVVPAERRIAAWDAVQRARSLDAGATAVDRDLIGALVARYSPSAQADRAPLDAAYAEAMVAVQRRHPADADVATLTAESLMDLQPWDLWTPEGRPKGRTEEIVALLEHAMELDPDHPGALHLYIHAVEASPDPARAVSASDRLRRLVPAAGHLVHMPAHIDVRVGRWQQATEANVRAAAADTAYRRVVPRQDFYHVYMAHNNHFLAYAAMMEGRFAQARGAARAMIAGVPEEFLSSAAALVDPYMAIEDQVLVRFGRWDEILARPEPPSTLPITVAHWRFARASALAAKGDVPGAEAEQARFREAAAAVPADAMMAINPAHSVLGIAEHVLAGEIAYRRGEIEAAVSELRTAARLEDGLRYMEPPEWIQPSRHSLGAVLLAAGRSAEAEADYLEDLARWPNNGWALHGLAASLRAQGRAAEADEARARFEAAWARADTTIHASCLCVRK